MSALRLLLLVVVAGCGDAAPRFVSVLAPSDTHDARGPYRVEAYVEAGGGLRDVVLRFGDGAGQLGATRHEADEDDVSLWTIDLPGRPVGTTFAYYLVAVGENGKKASFPDRAPIEQLHFAVLSQ